MINSERIKELRGTEIRQSEIAAHLGISQNRYCDYENEKDIFPIKHLVSLCNYLHVSLDYLFEFSDIVSYANSRYDIDLKVVSSRLKEFRKENKITQEGLAKELNVVKGTIGNYESARALIATPFLYEICKKYKISADYLLGKIDEPKYLK